jgi:hypothetical protein
MGGTSLKRNIEVCRKCKSFLAISANFGSVKMDTIFCILKGDADSVGASTIIEYEKLLVNEHCPYILEHTVMEEKTNG